MSVRGHYLITSFHSFNFNSFDTATINPPDDIELFGFKFSMRLDSNFGVTLGFDFNEILVLFTNR